MDVWAKIDSLKEKKDWSDFEVAKALGMTSKSYLYNIRRGLGKASPDAARDLSGIMVEAGLIAPEEVNAFIVGFLFPDPILV